MKRILLILGLGNLRAFGKALKEQDANNTGADDIFGGIILPATADAMELYLDGHLTKSDAIIDKMIDELCTFRGREVPPPAPVQQV